ncbi:MAG: Hsp20/alpha crystallin family protein [Geminicoccaceae bacterium]|jgi:HSP20 family protein|nr:Hsp20/alpha crystallin family protein [Geminicoccaceae bacterium]MCB9968111.1 Hsp20/alpha crystallin family protein [Geminicoccaceae bacterium]HRY25143.1 Hsp20/alpha crystallin family protein [Geminicoccaceae bacterium]
MARKSLQPFAGFGGLAGGGEADPFGLMRREMDRLFDSYSRDWPAPALAKGLMSPKVDVAETERGLEISAELPGIEQKDISLDLTDGILTLKAEHRAEKEEKDEKKHYHLVERSRGSFMRRFAVPFEPDADKVQASFENGVLKIEVPRSAAAEKQVRKIAIKGG